VKTFRVRCESPASESALNLHHDQVDMAPAAETGASLQIQPLGTQLSISLC
jgi:hypothetical protein